MAWNVRGLGLNERQAEVRRILKDNKVNVCGLVETRVGCDNICNVGLKIRRGWSWFSNADRCGSWVRIMVGWDPREVDLTVVDYNEQVIHCAIKSIGNMDVLMCSFVYGFTKIAGRRSLWKSLVDFSRSVRDVPWVLLGDFNAILNPDEKSNGCKRVNYGMEEFKCCINEMNVVDISMSGLFYTWNQKPGKSGGILEKLDRVMGNQKFVDVFPAAFAKFLPFYTSDHAPALLVLDSGCKAKHKPFKFWNYLAGKDEFMPTVIKGWNMKFVGCKMFVVVSKLKALKKPLRNLSFSQGNLHKKVELLRSEVERVQEEIVNDPCNEGLRAEEAVYVAAYKNVLLDEEYLLKQKSRVHWLKVGDQNSKYFHQSIKNRECRNKVNSLEDMDGTVFSGESVGEGFVKYFKGIMGVSADVGRIVDPGGLFVNKLSIDDAEQLVSKVSREEVKIAMFQIDDEKAPGPDGYTAKFFKSAWGVIGEDVTDAVLEFFCNGKLLKEINATIISVVPKVKVPNKVNQFRPIACCNVIYKCISKVLCNRLKNVLGKLVCNNQSAFVPGRLISDNILLSQELVKGYEWAKGCPRVSFKIDLQKAYDSVDHRFLEECLVNFGLHKKFISWIMVCMTSVHYSVAYHGNLYGFFKGERGLRQGDPISPYLFTLVMEVLNLMLIRRISAAEGFSYHWRCGKLNLTHLCFADDLFIFCGADVESVRVIKDTLDEFSYVSGLVPNMNKSDVIFGNVDERVQKLILEVLPFRVGVFPMKYLGIPLSSKRLYQKDCKVLIDRVKGRINDWKVKFLSFAGRVQLVKSVLSSITIYWASLYILPVAISEEIERLLSGFLWNQGRGSKGMARVKWEDICMAKCQGGLNISSLKIQNVALMSKHIWNVLSNKDSIWVRWVEKYKLCGKSIWEISETSKDSWSWRQILQHRSLVRDKFCAVIGNGKNDSFMWKMDNGKVEEYAVRRVYKSLCMNGPKVLWSGAVWFSQNIPKHAFILWLAFKFRLLTQDRLLSWGFVGDLRCSLCKRCPDSHKHLFFECEYALAVWRRCKVFGKMIDAPNSWPDIVKFVEEKGFMKSVWGVIGRLVLAASVYFIWQERNRRQFEEERRSVQQVWLVLEGWGRVGMLVVIMVIGWWVFGKGIVMYGYVGRKFRKFYVFGVVKGELIGKCVGIMLSVLECMSLVRSLLEFQEADERMMQEYFYVCGFAGFAGTWMEFMLLVIVCLLIVLMYRAFGLVICRIVVCLGRSRILMIHFVRLAALGVVYSLGCMSRESKPL
ncbi:putative RNA-directed DNA polymerase [Helianthus annuus]|uniref:RNA-directed DNA polymerase n=1 Tax=Helianthus annuus TaxID=4232 RepID=A0A9K3NVV7_HELAN|nr:putative RNA-directed DNA polymerase [Helianthus annuus]